MRSPALPLSACMGKRVILGINVHGAARLFLYEFDFQHRMNLDAILGQTILIVIEVEERRSSHFDEPGRWKLHDTCGRRPQLAGNGARML